MRFLLYLYMIASLVLMLSGLQERHYWTEDGRSMKAWFVTYPGFETAESPEQTVELTKWASMIYGKADPDSEDYLDMQGAFEEAAGKTLKRTFFYADYQLEQQPDGHWMLRKPAGAKERFSMKALYRISPGRPAN